MLILNGVLMSEAAATLPATDRALTHGLGLYETIKLEDGVPVFFEEHVARLVQGIAALGLDKAIDKPELAEQICRLSEANGGDHNSCRLLVTAGAPDGSPSLLVQTDRRDFPHRPLRVVTYRGVRVSAQYKAMTVMQSTFAQRAARAAGVDDALLVDGEGRIFEGATSNVFVVRAGGLITPPAEGDILPGVLRAKVEELATGAGIPVVEAWARVADLRPDDGVLLTSSIRGIVPVERVDGVQLLVHEQELTQAARAGRRSRGREHRRLPRDLPLATPRRPPAGAATAVPASRGYDRRGARNHPAMQRFAPHHRGRRPRRRGRRGAIALGRLRPAAARRRADAGARGTTPAAAASAAPRAAASPPAVGARRSSRRRSTSPST